MFKELAPYLRQRAVLMTVTHLEGDQIRVNIVPKKLKDGENEALTTPLSVTGTAEELDRELPETLTSYVASHLQLKNTLEKAKEEMEAAAKAAQAEARAKSKTSGKKEPSGQAVTKAAEIAKSVELPKPAVPKSPSLFDMGPAPSPEPASPTPALSVQSESSEEDEILSEINEDEDSEELPDAA
jgi:PRTRC genetic system protein E